MDDDLFKSESDLEDFVASDINKLLPLNRPQWRVYVVLNYLRKNKTLIIIKLHHSIGDGGSCVCMNLCLSGKYESELLMPYRLSFFNKAIAFLSLPLYLPTMLRVLFTLRIDDNVIKTR